MRKKIIFNNGWIALVLIFLTLFSFIAGYIAGLDIPEKIEIGLDDKTIIFMNEYYNLSNKNLSCVEDNFNLRKVDCQGGEALIKENNICYGCWSVIQ
jgi:hypothetical protein